MLGQSTYQPTPFEGRVRVRACGILKKEDGILLLKHQSIGPAGYLWSPPGGGVEFGESLEDTLMKEFMEETNLEIKVGPYLFANEYLGTKHHAIELFFEVSWVSGDLQLGKDPELPKNEQILSEARYFKKHELNEIPKNALHNAFHSSPARHKIDELKGLVTFKH